MKTIKLHYNLETGDILGYFFEDCLQVPVPYISIPESLHYAILGKESEFKVYNKEVISREEFPEHRKAELEKFSKIAINYITDKAQEAKSHGIISIDKYYVNSSWLEYYQALLGILNNESIEVCLKFYELKDNSYRVIYEKMDPKEAKALCEKIISGINSYRSEVIPAKLKENSSHIENLLEKKNYKEIKSFCTKLDYGAIAKD